MAATSLPDQIPPQSAPFIYQDDAGNFRMELDWYLFWYGFWASTAGQTGGGGVGLLEGVNIPMIDGDLPSFGPTLRDLTNVQVIALEAQLASDSQAAGQLTTDEVLALQNAVVGTSIVASGIDNDAPIGGTLGATVADALDTLEQNLNTLVDTPLGMQYAAGPGANQITTSFDPNGLQLPGTTSGSATAAGFIGERLNPAGTTGTVMTTLTQVNATSMSLPPGNWELGAACTFHDPAGSTTAPTSAVNFVACGISLVSATLPADPFVAQDVRTTGTTPSAIPKLAATPRPSNNASTITVYLVANASFAGNVSVDGYIWARRMQ